MNYPGQCKVCLSDMPKGALFCPTCNSYQSGWRNEVKYWSSVTGLATLIVSGIAVSVTLGDIIYRRIFGEEVSVSEMDVFAPTVIWNQTDFDLFLTELHISSESPTYDLRWGLYLNVKPKESARVTLWTVSKEGWHGDVERMFDPAKVGNFVPSMPSVDLDSFKKDTKESTDKYVADFIYRYGGNYRQLKDIYGDALTELPARCEISYILLDAKFETTHDVPCVGVIRSRVP